MANEQNINYSETVENALKKINNRKGWDGTGTIEWHGLYELLQEGINWSDIDPKTIIPKLELRKFTKSIFDKEVRRDVMKFLLDYTEYYFYDNALILTGYKPSYLEDPMFEKYAQLYITEFRTELSTQISQLEKTGEYSGDKFNKLNKQIEQLKAENKQLKNANLQLKAKVDRFEHPAKYGHYIPSELNNHIFREVMAFLCSKQIALPMYDDSSYGRQVCCYRWYGKKALFGYYVERMNQELDLNEARELLNWQIFEPAIDNYGELVEEARKVVSKYRKDPKAFLPAKADIINDAIRYANGEMKNAEIHQHL